MIRKRLAPRVEAGLVNCARCGKRILIGEKWDLGHAPDGLHYNGPEHRRCNRATEHHRRRRVSRVW